MQVENNSNLRKLTNKYAANLLGVFLAILLFCFAALPTRAQEYEENILEGEVVGTSQEQRVDPQGNAYLYQLVNIRIYKGILEGEVIQVENDTSMLTSSPHYNEGEKVVVAHIENLEGDDVFYITDYVRRGGLLLLFVVFAVMAVVIGGLWGLTSLIGMAFSFLVLFKIVLPQIINGQNAVLAAITGAFFIIPVTFCLSHGLKAKTWIASIGTVITLIITGLIATYAVNITKLTGFASEEAGFLQSVYGINFDMRGLLLAGIIISSLGILDDITISQASIVAELRQANKTYGLRELFLKGMNVGRDHIASLINTLVLVYAGASLPLLLLFLNNPSPFMDVVNIEIIADEIVRTLVGSMGLILAVPVTTFLAASYYGKKL